MSLELLLAWCGLAFLLAVSPGPDTLLVMGHAARRGTRAGLAAAAGIVTGGLWYMLLCGLGFLSLLQSSSTLFMVVKTAGAAYLVYLGIRLLMGAARGHGETAPSSVPLGAPFRQGLITNALNPKIALFYLAVLPQFVGNGPNAPLYGVLLIAIHYVMGGLFLGMVALVTGRASRAFAQTRFARGLEATLGAVFVGLGGRLALERN